MKQSEIIVGGVYHARVSGKFVHVRVNSIGENYFGRTTYAVTNLMTGRKITFRSAMKFRGKVIAKAGNAIHMANPDPDFRACDSATLYPCGSVVVE